MTEGTNNDAVKRADLPAAAESSASEGLTHRSGPRPVPGRAPWRRGQAGTGEEPEGPQPSVGQLLWEWENPAAHPFRRRLMAWLQARRPGVRMATYVIVAFMAGATLAFVRQNSLDALALEAELRRTDQQLKARQGELELVRLEMARLQTVMAQSRNYRIPADLAADIYDIARQEGIDPVVAFSLVRVESAFLRNAVSSKGAVGLTQLMPSTAAFLEPGIAYQQLFDRQTNLRIGFRYLRMLLQQYDGDLRLALLAYNRGPTRVDSIRRAGGDPNNGYPRMVLGFP
jgi:soluble lytic murein transglycosylase-like protein